jgi:sortase A
VLIARRAAPLAALALVLAGAALGGHGLYLRAKAELAQLLLERAFAATLATGGPVKAWPWADTWPVARLAFPRLGRSAIVLAEGGGEALAFGPAHVAATPRPGEPGTSVIAGHRDTHFRFLAELGPGEEVELTAGDGRTRRFRVTGTALLHADASGIEAAGGEPRLALVTCWSPDGLLRGPLRYVVFAEEEASAATSAPAPRPAAP